MPNYAGFRRAWTEDELIQIEVMLHAGEPVHVIARALRRPAYAIRNRHEIARLRQGTVFERGELARLFGVNDKTAVFWQRRGWLPRTRNGASSIERQQQEYAEFRTYFREVTGFTAPTTPSEPIRPGKHSAYLIPIDAVHAFIENRETWVAWQPEQITDDGLRTYAQELRQLADGHWVTTAEVAARYGYSPGTVWYWRHAQHMDGIATVKYGSAVFFWSADLGSWTPPGERTSHPPAPAPTPTGTTSCPYIGPDGVPMGRRAYQVLHAARYPVTTTQLTERFDMSRRNAYNYLSRFERRGWVIRTPDPLDEQAYCYQICVPWEPRESEASP